MITYCFLGLFFCMMGYFVYFQVVRSEDFINSSYNTRQDSFANSVIRGDIISVDGQILAKTETDAKGTETRIYPFDNMFSHIVGYSTVENGRAGIEAWANFNLLRSNSFFLEKAVAEVTDNKSRGDNVYTTLDSSVQKTAYNALGNQKGAVAVIEPSTGKILAMVSKPDFNPNTITADWDSIVADENAESALLNRAAQGLYPPGSTFKILTTLEYIREHPDYQEYSYQCTGSIKKENSQIRCFGGEVHGAVDLKRSFTKSCNCSIASMGLSIDSDNFLELCNTLLFNKALPTGLDTSKSSFVLKGTSTTSQIMETAIGQGETLVTPLHMAMITAAIANDGVLMKPYVIQETKTYDGNEVKSYSASAHGEVMTTEEAKILQEYMLETVQSGTASKLGGMSYTAGGKTGSAEYSNTKGESHAWFVGYASREDKGELAIAVIVEGAGIGSAHAVPIAKEVFDAYYGY